MFDYTCILKCTNIGIYQLSLPKIVSETGMREG